MDWARKRSRLQENLFGRLFLGFCSLFYGAVALARRFLYDHGYLKSRSLGAKVISIGNLTAGGTGKTPAVLLAARALRQAGRNVAILTRGYGRPSAGQEALVLLEDKSIPWTQCGDEPWMMRAYLQGLGIPILVAPDRAKAGLTAVSFYHSDVLILDDGFQHRKLKRDLDILMVNCRAPFEDGHMLPLGDFREPLSSLARAHMVVLTHADMVDGSRVQSIRETIAAINPNISILESVHRSDFLLELKTEKRHPLTLIKNRDVVAFSAIADPESFESQLESLGGKIVQKWRYPDHHPYALEEIRALQAVSAGTPIVTTFKDVPRLPAQWREILTGEIYVLGIKLDIIKGEKSWNDALCAGL